MSNDPQFDADIERAAASDPEVQRLETLYVMEAEQQREPARFALTPKGREQLARISGARLRAYIQYRREHAPTR